MTTEQGAEGTTYYKAVRPDGTDFRTGTVNYLAGGVIHHPHSERMVHNVASTYLSISVEPAETLIGGSWPCRLLRVQPVGEVLDDLEASRYKRACLALEVLEELPAWKALGPNGEHVAALIERAKSITALRTAWDTARDTAGDAAGALVVRDVLPPEHYRVLTEPWARAIGKVHPDDEEVSA